MCKDDTIEKKEAAETTGISKCSESPGESFSRNIRSSGRTTAGTTNPSADRILDENTLFQAYVNLIELFEGENRRKILGRLDPAIIVAMSILRDDSICEIASCSSSSTSEPASLEMLRVITFETLWHGYLLSMAYHEIKNNIKQFEFKTFLDSGILSQRISILKTAIAPEVVREMLPEKDSMAILSVAATIVNQALASFEFAGLNNREELIESVELLVLQGVLLGLLEFEIKAMRKISG